MSEYHQALRKAIWNMHGSDAVHVESVPVKETANGQVIWEGAVEVFDLVGHAKAKRSYAWGFPNERGREPLNIFAVLGLGQITSPQSAVRAVVESPAA